MYWDGDDGWGDDWYGAPPPETEPYSGTAFTNDYSVRHAPENDIDWFFNYYLNLNLEWASDDDMCPNHNALDFLDDDYDMGDSSNDGDGNNQGSDSFENLNENTQNCNPIIIGVFFISMGVDGAAQIVGNVMTGNNPFEIDIISMVSNGIGSACVATGNPWAIIFGVGIPSVADAFVDLKIYDSKRDEFFTFQMYGPFEKEDPMHKSLTNFTIDLLGNIIFDWLPVGTEYSKNGSKAIVKLALSNFIDPFFASNIKTIKTNAAKNVIKIEDTKNPKKK